MSGCRTAWMPVSRAATFTGRPTRTVWQWVEDGLVSTRMTASGLEVWFFDVWDRSAERPRRNRRKAA